MCLAPIVITVDHPAPTPEEAAAGECFTADGAMYVLKFTPGRYSGSDLAHLSEAQVAVQAWPNEEFIWKWVNGTYDSSGSVLSLL